MTDHPTLLTEQIVYKKTLLTLPPEVSDAFARAEDTEIRNAYMAALRGLGWTLQSVSAASGVTRERVRQIVKAGSDVTLPTDFPLPAPPARAVRAPREFVEPAPEKLARLLELQPAAQAVRSNSPKYRKEGEEYTKLLAEVHLEDGVPLYRLALRLGVTHGALRFRLARYLYKLPKDGTSKVYTPILEENRVRPE
jgi:hypothetical protein